MIEATKRRIENFASLFLEMAMAEKEVAETLADSQIEDVLHTCSEYETPQNPYTIRLAAQTIRTACETAREERANG